MYPPERSDRISCNAHLIFPILLRPVLARIDRRNRAAAEELLETFKIVDAQSPDILLEFVEEILLHSVDFLEFHATHQVNLTESLLNIQSIIPEYDEQICYRSEESFREFKNKTFLLKRNLSRLTKEVSDRNKVLATIRRIAELIKNVLDFLNIILTEITNKNFNTRMIEVRKREFVSSSKNFSAALKEFFRGKR